MRKNRIIESMIRDYAKKYNVCEYDENLSYSENIEAIRLTQRNRGLGIKNRYEEYLVSDEWIAKKQKVLKRAGYKCEGCGCKNIPLEVHHINYDRRGYELLTDLVAYCDDCHELAHDYIAEEKEHKLRWSKYLNGLTDIKPRNWSDYSDKEKKMIILGDCE